LPGKKTGLQYRRFQISRLQLFEMINQLFADTVVIPHHEKLFIYTKVNRHHEKL